MSLLRKYTYTCSMSLRDLVIIIFGGAQNVNRRPVDLINGSVVNVAASSASVFCCHSPPYPTIPHEGGQPRYTLVLTSSTMGARRQGKRGTCPPHLTLIKCAKHCFWGHSPRLLYWGGCMESFPRPYSMGTLELRSLDFLHFL